MQNEILASIVAIIHLLLIVGVFAGIFISYKLKKYRPVESFILLAAVVIWSLYDGCPLTYLENYFHTGSMTLSSPLLTDGFIAFYLNSYLGLAVSNQAVTIATYGLVLFFLILSIDWLVPLFHLKRIIKRKR